MTRAMQAPALEELRRLQEVLDRRREAPAAIEREREEALRAVGAAQAALVDYYATLGLDEAPAAKRVAELRAAIGEAEAVVTQPWAERLEGAERAIEAARDELLGYMQANFEEIGRPLFEASLEAQRDLAVLLDAAEDRAAIWESRWLEWNQLTGRTGRDLGELPDNTPVLRLRAVIEEFFADGPALPAPARLQAAVNHESQEDDE
jgi:hypothetical protein